MVRRESLSSTIRIWAGARTCSQSSTVTYGGVPIAAFGRSLALSHFAPRDQADIASRHATGRSPVQRAFAEDCGFDGSLRSANTKRARTHDQDVVRILTWISVEIVRIVSDPNDDVGERRSSLCNHPVERRVPEQAPQRAIGCSGVKEIALDLPLGRQTRETENPAVR